MRSILWKCGSPVVSSCLLILVAPTTAPAQGGSWSVRAGGGLVNSSTDAVPPGSTAIAEADSGTALAFEINRTLTPGLSLQVGLLSYGVPLELRTAQSTLSTDGFRRSALSIGVLIDLLRLPRVNVYAGPLVAVTSRDSAVTDDGALRVEASGAGAVGVQGGFRWPGFTDRQGFALDANVRWPGIRESLSTGGRLRSPIVTTVGVLYRF